jgi:outer membrane protein
VKNFLLTLLAAAIGFTCASAQSQKIGFVNTAKIVDELPEGKEAKGKLEDFTRTVQDSLASLSKQLSDMEQDYQKKSALMTEQSKQQAQRDFEELRRRAVEYQQRKQEEGSGMREKLYSPVLEKINKAVERVSKEERYNIVIDQTVVLYSDLKDDLTNRVIDKIKRGK